MDNSISIIFYKVISMIEAKRSSVIVRDYKWNSNVNCEYLFCIVRIDGSYEYKGIDYDAENEILYLPRGMDLTLLERLFREKIVVSDEYDEYDSTGPIMIKKLPRNDVQKQAIKFILGIAEYQYTLNYSQLHVNLVTSKGKTYVAISSIAYLQIKTIVITAIKGWLKQWYDKIPQYTDIDQSEILYLNSKVINKILLGSLDLSEYKFFLCTHSALADFANENGWNLIGELFKKLKVGIKIFDEAHLYFDNMTKIDLHTNTYKTLYLTATPHRSDKKENEIYEMVFKKVPSIELFNREEDAKTKYMSIHYNSHPTQFDLGKLRANPYKFDRMYYAHYIMTKDSFWMILHIIMNKVVKKVEGKTVFIFAINEQIFKMKDWIDEFYPEYKDDIGLYYGKTSTDDSQKEHKIILSNVQCSGTALDCSNLNVAVMCAPIKSKVQSQQAFGRPGREEGMTNLLYIELVDEGVKKIKEFYSFKQSVFMKYAKECVRIIYRDQELKDEYTKIMRNRKRLEKLKKDMTVKCPYYIKD